MRTGRSCRQRRTRWAALFLLVACFTPAVAAPGTAALLPPQFTMPSPGEEVERDFPVTTATTTRHPCIALPTHDQHVVALVSRRLLHQMAAASRDYTDDAGRLASIAGQRAQRLLATVATSGTVHGCAQARLEGEAQYVLARLLDSGQVALFDAQAKRIVPGIVVSVSAMPGIGGMVSYRLQDSAGTGRWFFAYQAWVH